MRVFVSEYVCGGAWPDGTPPASLAREGRSMLSAVLADFSRIDGCETVATWDTRLGEPPTDLAGANNLRIVGAANADEEISHFKRLSAESAATFVIAPEFDDVLTNRCRLVIACGGTLLGPTPSAVTLCSDKLALARHFKQQGIPTVSTLPVDGFSAKHDFAIEAFPLVVKPRDGAGSLDVRLCRTRSEFELAISARRDATTKPAMIVQPYIAGLSLSISAIISPDREKIDMFPLGRQRLSDDGTFQYLGGEIPVNGVDFAPVKDLISRAVRSIPGLHGYIGFDLIQLDDDPSKVVICEINPRLTTSYLGYRELTDENLAERLLRPTDFRKPIEWKRGSVSFTSDGTVTHEN